MFKEFQYKKTTISVLTLIASILLFSLVFDLLGLKKHEQASKPKTNQTVKQARLMANGDILIHDILYTSAQKADNSYDFDPYFEYVKDWIKQADLAIADYEGTISPDFPLAGYPLFNAPSEIANAIKDTGYDVVDLAHNHILDSQLEGALHTKKVFSDLGIDSIGVYENNRETDPF